MPRVAVRPVLRVDRGTRAHELDDRVGGRRHLANALAENVEHLAEPLSGAHVLSRLDSRDPETLLLPDYAPVQRSDDTWGVKLRRIRQHPQVAEDVQEPLVL